MRIDVQSKFCRALYSGALMLPHLCRHWQPRVPMNGHVNFPRAYV